MNYSAYGHAATASCCPATSITLEGEFSSTVYPNDGNGFHFRYSFTPDLKFCSESVTVSMKCSPTKDCSRYDPPYGAEATFRISKIYGTKPTHLPTPTPTPRPTPRPTPHPTSRPSAPDVGLFGRVFASSLEQGMVLALVLVVALLCLVGMCRRNRPALEKRGCWPGCLDCLCGPSDRWNPKVLACGGAVMQ